MAPTYTTASTKYGIHRVDGSTNVSDVDAAINQAVDDLDAAMAGYAEGTLSARAAVTATAGKLYRTTDTGQVFMGTGSTWVEIGVSPWAPGDLKWSWLTADHSGWLLCDGRAVSRATYAALFAAIGTSVSVGDGSTTFGIPDFRGRTVVMPDGAAGRMASNDARANSGGEETHVLTPAETALRAHTHYPGGDTGYFAQYLGGGGIVYFNGGGEARPGADQTGSIVGGQQNGAAHGNMPPYLCAGGVFVRTT